MNKIEGNSFFEEPLGEVKILDHYHSVIFYINTTKLFHSYEILFHNSQELKYTTLINNFIHKTQSTLDLNLKRIWEQLNKLDSKRTKRGLINGLGSIIKFISGNLDDNDLRTINENINRLYNNKGKN